MFMPLLLVRSDIALDLEDLRDRIAKKCLNAINSRVDTQVRVSGNLSSKISRDGVEF